MQATKGAVEALENAEEANHSEAMLHKPIKGAMRASPVVKKDTSQEIAQIKGLTWLTSLNLTTQAS